MIGFSNGVLANVDDTWPKVKAGRAYMFQKTRIKSGHFEYSCKRLNSCCGFVTDRNLSREEVEGREQFVDFMLGTE
jgi:hypothetical protein